MASGWFDYIRKIYGWLSSRQTVIVHGPFFSIASEVFTLSSVESEAYAIGGAELEAYAIDSSESEVIP